jgi:hypothetical protein
MTYNQFSILALVVISWMFCFRSLPATAAEFLALVGPELRTEAPAQNADGIINCTHQISGQIEAGDLAKFQAMLRTIEYGGDATLCFESPGGNFHEATQIAKELKTSRIRTALTRNSTCLSACAFIFMAGSYGRSDVLRPARYMHATARLGFHGPYVAAASLPATSFSPSDIADAHRSARLATQTLIDIFVRTEYSRYHFDRDLWVKPSLLRVALAKDSRDFFLIDTIGKAGNYGIGIVGLKGPARSNDKSLGSLCKNLYLWNIDKFEDKSVQVDRLSGRELRSELETSQGFAAWFSLAASLGHNVNRIAAFSVADRGSGGTKCAVIVGPNGGLEVRNGYVQCSVWLISITSEAYKRLCPERWHQYDSRRKLH